MSLDAPISNLVSFKSIGTLAHGPVLKNKCKTTDDKELNRVLDAYNSFIVSAENITFDISIIDQKRDAIHNLTTLLNTYRSVAIPVLESRDNSGQENLRSTILEEFFQLLIYPLIRDVLPEFDAALTLGKANSYVSLTYAPKSFLSLFENPAPQIHTKDQDFVLGCSMQILSKINDSKSNGSNLPQIMTNVVIPVIAIECKTYIERNMLDSCAGTAKRLKTAMPYCLYIVVAEYMKMDDAYPELTDIDEVFILTRTSNADRLKFVRESKDIHPISSDLIYAIFQMVETHLNKIWWSPEDALVRGRVINRP